LFKVVSPVVVFSILMAVTGGITLVVALMFASLRRRRARVFISYQREMWNYASALAEVLKRSGVEPLIVPFQSDVEHDQLLDRIYFHIDQADFVVCFPGLRPSFVEHEVAAAVSRKKPIFIILPRRNAGAPNTAQHSYPVLCLERLLVNNFQPLVELIHYLRGDMGQTLRLYFTPTRLPTLAQAVGGTIGYLMVAAVAVLSLPGYFKHLPQRLLLNVEVSGYVAGVGVGASLVIFAAWLMLALTGNFAVGGIATIRNRAMAIRQTRRLLRDGSYSYPVLRQLFRPTKGLLRLLKPFFCKPPQAYHQYVEGDIETT